MKECVSVKQEKEFLFFFVVKRQENDLHKKCMLFEGSVKYVSSLLFLQLDKNELFHCI